ncbi:hypothetical protein DMUE_2212 [Dictyocoela muelleri]|nr:hypothetical protein DMUE_2212 [Dictyocoela muelleri]
MRNLISIYHKIFINNDTAKEFLRQYNQFIPITRCDHCENTNKKLKKDSKRLNNLFYYCADCKKNPCTSNQILKTFKKGKHILRLVYGFISNFDYVKMELLT